MKLKARFLQDEKKLRFDSKGRNDPFSVAICIFPICNPALICRKARVSLKAKSVLSKEALSSPNSLQKQAKEMLVSRPSRARRASSAKDLLCLWMAPNQPPRGVEWPTPAQTELGSKKVANR
ncbi:hypothetical protein JTE90_002317 [Oedothorax gibbosus]|uniref:Uncharacterized protein n=1 Tax=Oedothorax gibbosus TaxID=931172 RepID=A0AAV6UJ82_9ARAC|nr:hypothetical protein JTE90_002317 [Oedothorax gibbosus]